MGKTYSIIGIGSITSIFGLIFHLQGQSVIGPESSFMYANPNWITYGIGIMICGIIVISVGIISKVLKK
jgi:membrane protein YdbS with pleckstrin-like domain